MWVGGVVRCLTGDRAQRAALGGGAIVMDILASNDGRLPHERIERIRRLRPDMILLSGGVDGGTTKHVADMADLIAAADPKPRLGQLASLPWKKASGDLRRQYRRPGQGALRLCRERRGRQGG